MAVKLIFLPIILDDFSISATPIAAFAIAIAISATPIAAFAIAITAFALYHFGLCLHDFDFRDPCPVRCSPIENPKSKMVLGWRSVVLVLTYDPAAITGQ
jgi:hypothetical protein